MGMKKGNNMGWGRNIAKPLFGKQGVRVFDQSISECGGEKMDRKIGKVKLCCINSDDVQQGLRTLAPESESSDIYSNICMKLGKF